MQALTNTVVARVSAGAPARAAKPTAAPRMALKAPLAVRSAFAGSAAPLRAAVSAVESTGVRAETTCKARPRPRLRLLSRLRVGLAVARAPRPLRAAHVAARRQPLPNAGLGAGVPCAPGGTAGRAAWRPRRRALANRSPQSSLGICAPSARLAAPPPPAPAANRLARPRARQGCRAPQPCARIPA